MRKQVVRICTSHSQLVFQHGVTLACQFRASKCFIASTYSATLAERYAQLRREHTSFYRPWGAYSVHSSTSIAEVQP